MFSFTNMVTIIYNHETDLKCLQSGRRLHIHCHYCAVLPMNQSTLSVLSFLPGSLSTDCGISRECAHFHVKYKEIKLQAVSVLRI